MGLTPSPGSELVNRVYRELTSRYGPSYRWRIPGVLPQGLRIEIHPNIYYMMNSDRRLIDFFNPLIPHQGVEEMFRIPLQVNLDLEEWRWRIVIVREEVIDSGEFPRGEL